MQEETWKPNAKFRRLCNKIKKGECMSKPDDIRRGWGGDDALRLISQKWSYVIHENGFREEKASSAQREITTVKVS